MNRREQMKALVGLAGLRYLPQTPQSPPGGAIPPEGIGRRIRHLAYSDIGGRPDSVQIMWNRNHLYVGHMFSNGLTVLDAADPRRLKPVGFFTGGDYTRTHHLQVAEDLLLVANGANIVAMQSYDNLRGYFENALADSITNRKKFRSGLSIHDISHPPEMKEIAFLEMPGLGINRLWWPGGRYAYVAAHFDGFTDHILVHRRSEEHHKTGDRVALVAARNEPGRGGNLDAGSRPPRRIASYADRRQSRIWRLARRRPDRP